jgi:hypothetical protein
MTGTRETDGIGFIRHVEGKLAPALDELRHGGIACLGSASERDRDRGRHLRREGRDDHGHRW